MDQREALNKYSRDGSAYSTRSDALSDLRARLVRNALIAAALGARVRKRGRIRGSGRSEMA